MILQTKQYALYVLLGALICGGASAQEDKRTRLWLHILSEELNINDSSLTFFSPRVALGHFFRSSVYGELSVSTAFFSDISTNYRETALGVRYYPYDQGHPYTLENSQTSIQVAPSHATYGKLEFVTKSFDLSGGSRSFTGIGIGGGIDLNKGTGFDYNFEGGGKILSAPTSLSSDGRFYVLYLSVGVGRFL